MACDLTKGRGLDCRDAVGGIKAVYFIEYDKATLTTSGGSISDIDLTAPLRKYKLKRGTGSFTETINPSSENGTVFYTPSINIKLHNMTANDRNEIKLLAQNRLIIFVETNSAGASGITRIWCCGESNGMELSAGTSASGVALGDMNGYDLTFEGQEPEPCKEVQDYTTAPFDNSGFTVTVDAD